jgi:hypothetical protein
LVFGWPEKPTPVSGVCVFVSSALSDVHLVSKKSLPARCLPPLLKNAPLRRLRGSPEAL